MKDTCYLTFNAGSLTGFTKRPPSLKSGQYAVRVTVNVDDKYFRRTIPAATLVIDETHMLEPEVEVDMAPASP